MSEFREQAATYATELTDFADLYKLPKEWFRSPDHVAVKAMDAVGFEALVEQFRDQADQLSCIDMDGRRLATVRLLAPIAVGTWGKVRWVELMEPRPAKVGKDVVGFEHMEFTFPDFTTVREYLGQSGVDYKMEKNEGHAWVNIVINDEGQELKINNRPLAEIVEQELEEGISYLL